MRAALSSDAVSRTHRGTRRLFRPSRAAQSGIATFALRRALALLAAKGVREALVTCAESNVASARVIKSAADAARQPRDPPLPRSDRKGRTRVPGMKIRW